jgi:hypothetical protein
MFSNPALDVVIGLVFIYLLYSLYATIIMEIISSTFGLRAKNLKYAIARMLKDEKKYPKDWHRGIHRVVNSFSQIMGISTNLTYPTLYDRFYKQPNIKYLGNGGIANKPSYISAENFSKSLIESIRINDPDMSVVASVEEGLHRFQTHAAMKAEIEMLLHATGDDLKKFKLVVDLWDGDTIGRTISAKTKKQLFALLENANDDPAILKADLKKWYAEDIQKHDIGPETRKQITSILNEANNDVVKFRLLVEQWYNDTMERATGWFKRSTQMILLVIGFALAVIFNVDTIAIIKKLSIDKDARAQMVKLATDFTNDNATLINQVRTSPTLATDSANLIARLDSLQIVKRKLERDIQNAQNIFSSSWNIPDTVRYELSDKILAAKGFVSRPYKINDSTTVYAHLPQWLNTNALLKNLGHKNTGNQALDVDRHWYKLYYIFSGNRLWGYVFTMLALSLGAPFWFDLLNKLVKLRSSQSISSDSGGSKTTVSASVTKTILNRAG